MKNKLFIIFALIITGFVFAACSDNDGLLPAVNNMVDEKEELVPITFNVGFTKEVIPMRSSSSSNVMPKYLQYYAFNHNGGWWLRKSGTIIDSDGSFVLELSKSTYTIIFVGYNTGNVSIIGKERLYPPYGEQESPLDYQLQVLEDDGQVADQFYQKLECNVYQLLENKENVSVTLERIVSKIEIVLDEVIPSEVTKIKLSIAPIYCNKYYFSKSDDRGGTFNHINGLGGESYYREIQISESDKLAKGFTISFLSYAPWYAPNFSSPYFTVVLESQGREKVIPIKAFQKNKTLRYTGKLFEIADTSAPFTLSIDDTWEGTDEITF
jgi:hypothetical protein